MATYNDFKYIDNPQTVNAPVSATNLTITQNTVVFTNAAASWTYDEMLFDTDQAGFYTFKFCNVSGYTGYVNGKDIPNNSVLVFYLYIDSLGVKTVFL